MLLAASEMVNVPVRLVLFLVMGALVITTMISFSKRYKRCPSGKLLVITGKTPSGKPEICQSGAAFIWPQFQGFEFIDLQPFVLSLADKDYRDADDCVVSMRASATLSVSGDISVVEPALGQLLGMKAAQLKRTAQDVVERKFAEVINGVKCEVIESDRPAFNAKLKESIAQDLPNMGLQIVSMSIESIKCSKTEA